MPCTIHDLKPIDKSTPIPLYFQLKTQFKDMIQSGVLVEGDLIPAENELVDNLHISRPTVRQALNELVVEGFLERCKGKGTFVSSPKIDAKFLKRLKTFNEEMQEQGLTPSTALLSLKKVEGRAEINEKLGLARNAELIELKRVRSANGDPILYQETYLPYERCAYLMQEDFSQVTLYSALEKIYGIHVHRVNRQIEAANATPHVARLLHIATNNAVSLVRTVAYTDSDEPIEYSTSYYCGNRVKFSVELYR